MTDITVPEALINKLTAQWRGSNLPEEDRFEGQAVAVIEWLNDWRNHDEAAELVDDLVSDGQVQLLEGMSSSAHKIIRESDDTQEITDAIRVMQLLEELVTAVRETQG